MFTALKPVVCSSDACSLSWGSTVVVVGVYVETINEHCEPRRVGCVSYVLLVYASHPGPFFTSIKSAGI